MMQAAPLDAPPAPASRARRRKLPIHLRARSVPYRRPYIIALLLTACFYLALIGTVASLFAFMVVPGKNAASLLIGYGGFSAVLWLVSFLKRRSCHCPLCKGTPLADNAAHTHHKAVRFFPLTHGTTNVIRGIVRQNFRCQYCGTSFDLLKPVTRYEVDEGSMPMRSDQPATVPPFGASRT